MVRDRGRRTAGKKNEDEKVSSKLVLKPKGGLRAIFVHLLEPDEYGDGDKYTITVLIPKKDKKLVADIKKVIAGAMEKGKNEVWAGKNHKKAKSPLKDGDEEDLEKYPYYENCYYIQAKTNQKPKVIDRERNTLDSNEEVYSGMYVYVSMAAFPYFNEGWGVTMILGNVVKVADGERLGGGAGFDIEDEFGDELEEDEFADEDDEDDEDEDDEDDEDEDDEDELDFEDAEDLISDANEIDGGKSTVRKLLKKAGVKKVTDITDEDALDDFVEALEDWIEENE